MNPTPAQLRLDLAVRSVLLLVVVLLALAAAAGALTKTFDAATTGALAGAAATIATVLVTRTDVSTATSPPEGPAA